MVIFELSFLTASGSLRFFDHRRPLQALPATAAGEYSDVAERAGDVVEAQTGLRQLLLDSGAIEARYAALVELIDHTVDLAAEIGMPTAAKVSCGKVSIRSERSCR